MEDADAQIFAGHGPLYGLHRNASYTMVICYPAVQVSSNGCWVGDNPFFYTLPTVLLQCSIIIIFCRVLHFLLRPLNQSSFVSNMLAAIIVGPFMRGQFQSITSTIFPDFTVFISSTASSLGVIYYMFILGVRLDVSMIFRGKKTTTIALSGIVLSIAAGALVMLPFRSHTTNVMADGPFHVVVISTLATSPFPVVHQLLAEFRLLNSEIGRVALPVALVNHFFGWLTLIFLESTKNGEFDMKSVLVHLSMTVAFVAFAFAAFRPIMLWIIRRTPEGKNVESCYVVAILLGVLVTSLVTEFMGLSMVEGPMIMGVVIPDGPPLGSTLAEKIETLLNNFMLPFFFLNSALFIGFSGVADWTAVGVIFLAVFITRISKLIVTLVVGISCNMTFHDSFSLGVVLCGQGTIEIMTYSQWVIFELLNLQAYSSLVISVVVTTTIVAPLVKSLTVRSRPLMPNTWHTIQHCNPHAELRVLTCVHHQDHVPAMLSLLDAMSNPKDSPICIYAMHVVELVGRATPLLIAHKPNKKSIVSSSSSNSIFAAFRGFECHFDGHVLVQLFTSVAPIVSMHKDVCSVALERRVALVLVPFHKQHSVDGGLNTVDPVLHAMIPNIVREAPCSVGIVVDRHFRGRFSCAVIGSNDQHVGVFFLGGPDDREALCFASHMAEHPRVTLAVWRFIFKESVGENSMERRADDELMANFRMKNSGNGQVVYKEVLLADGEELLSVMRDIEDVYDMVMVGRHQAMNAELEEGLELWSENPELGPLGDLCSSSDFFGGTATVLVMLQQIVRRAHS